MGEAKRRQQLDPNFGKVDTYLVSEVERIWRQSANYQAWQECGDAIFIVMFDKLYPQSGLAEAATTLSNKYPEIVFRGTMEPYTGSPCSAMMIHRV
jgi:hypothetical protein